MVLTRILTVLTVIAAAAGCSSQRTVEFINTSGASRVVVVMGAADNFFTDTVPAGKTLCWSVPDVARGEEVKIVVAPVYTMAMLERRPVEGAWMDSTSLTQSTRVHIHAPRSIEPSAEWKARRAEKEREVDAWFQSAMALAAQGRSPATVEQILALRESRLTGPMFEEGAPQVQATATISRTKACER